MDARELFAESVRRGDRIDPADLRRYVTYAMSRTNDIEPEDGYTLLDDIRGGVPAALASQAEYLREAYEPGGPVDVVIRALELILEQGIAPAEDELED